jgi:hypothetical protein
VQLPGFARVRQKKVAPMPKSNQKRRKHHEKMNLGRVLFELWMKNIFGTTLQLKYLHM